MNADYSQALFDDPFGTGRFGSSGKGYGLNLPALTDLGGKKRRKRRGAKKARRTKRGRKGARRTKKSAGIVL